MALAMSLMSCNKKDDTPTTSNDYDVYTTTSTLVSAFSFKANTKIMAHLDSVKFTIDQEKCIKCGLCERNCKKGAIIATKKYVLNSKGKRNN